MSIENLIAQKAVFKVQMIDKPATKLIESEAIDEFMENVIEVLTEHAEAIEELKGA